MTDSDTYQAALAYAARGWSLVALHWITAAGQCSCGRPGCKSAGKHPINGAWQTRSEEVHRWTPGHAGELNNIGIRTGTPSGFWVLDFDPADVVDDDGHGLLQQLADAGYAPHVRTGGGGYHWRFLLPDFEVRNRQSAGGGAGRTHGLPRGWDVRGEGGQVVAPPSVSAKGAYVEIEGDSMFTYAPPMWLLEMIRPPERSDPPNHTVSANYLNGQPAQPGGLAGGTALSMAEGSSHSADRVQAYCTAALIAECEEYASLTDGRRGEAAAAFGRRLVELANLARWPLEAVEDHFARAMEAAASNGGGGGYAPHEVVGQWARAVEHVGGRAAVMPPGPDILPGFTSPFPSVGVAGLADLRIVEPGDVRHGVNGAGPAPVTGMTPAPSGGPMPPAAMDPWARALQREVWQQDVREAAKEYRTRRAAAGRPPLASEALDGDTLDSVPDPVPLIDGWLFMDSLARINGKPGQGKSFIAADLALSVATGIPWRGVPVRQGPVVALVAEGLSGFKQRVRAWESDRGTKAGRMLHLFPRAVQATGPEWPEFIEWVVAQHPVLITLDTQARISVGVKENDPTAQGELVHALEELRRRTGAAVLVVHHASKAGTDDSGRGSNAMEGAMVSEFFVTKSGFTITMKTTKQKDIETPKPMNMTLKKVGESAVIDNGPGIVELSKDMSRERAIALYHIMQRHFGGDGGMGGTRAQIDAHLKTDPSMAGLNMGSGQNGPKAILAAWRSLISRGLVIKADGAERFKVIELETVGSDGVLTPAVGVDGPDGWSVWCPEAATLANGKIPVPMSGKE